MSLALTALDSALTAAQSLALALPDPDPVVPPGFEGVTSILGWAKWIGLAAAIGALIVAAVMLMFAGRRGEGGEHFKTIVMILIGVMVIGAATSLVGFISGA